MCKFVDRRGGRWKRSGRSNFGRVGIDAPIGSEPCDRINLIGLEICFFRQFETVDEVAPAQRTDLAVGHVENPL
jgi:hypothetical protein